MPFPNQETQFQPGQSGNPGGYSRGRRITDALAQLIDEMKADPKIARVWLAKAIGDKRMLRGEDGIELEPDFRYLKELLDRIDGKVADRVIDETPDVIEFQWEDTSVDQDATPASGPAGGEEAPGAIQEPGLWPSVGEDAAGCGDVPGDGP